MPRVVLTGGGVGDSSAGHELGERGPIANGHVIPDDDPLLHHSRFVVASQP